MQAKDALQIKLIEKNQVVNFDYSCKIPLYADNPKKRKKFHANKILPIHSEEYYLNLLSSVELKNYANKFDGKTVPETSPYVELPIDEKERLIVKKTSLCWLLRKDCSWVSRDRLERIKNNTKRRIKRRGIYIKTIAPNKVVFSSKTLIEQKLKFKRNMNM